MATNATKRDGDRLLDVAEAAAMLGLKKATLYQWAHERRIPCVKPAGPRGPLRFRLSTLQRLMAQWERPALRPGLQRDLTTQDEPVQDSDRAS